MTGTAQVHDPTVLRAIAHPVRNRILTELDAVGPMRAADVARELGIPANQASFHLRQLAKYGLVEEAPDAARDRRDRVWRATAAHGLSLDLGEIEQAPGGRAAAAVFRRHAAARGHAIVDAAYEGARTEGTYRSISESALRLTREEAEELAGELLALLERWTERTRGAAGGADRRTYLHLSVLQPHPERLGQPPAPEED